MTDLLRLVTEGDRRSLPTLSQLSANDVENIWADVSAYIENRMALQKGVHVAGLGTFTFSQHKLDLGNKSIMIQRPIFILSGKLVHSLGLKQARPLAEATHLPVVPLNYTAVSKETPFSRGTVEGCIRETLLLLVRSLASESNVSLSFQGIGVLSFKNNKVRMKFRKDFINALDGSASILLAFKNRPGSSASLMSGGLSRIERPLTAVNVNTLPTVHSPEPANQPGLPDQQNVGGDHTLNKGVTQQSELKSHRQQQPAKTKAVIQSKEMNPKPQVEACDNSRPITSPPETLSKKNDPHMNAGCFGHTRAGQELCYLCLQRANRNIPLYQKEQREAEEKAQEKLLLLKEQQKDQLFFEKEQAKLSEQREYAKEVSAFNLCMSAKKAKTLFPLGPTSFIFPLRPLTPTPRLKQHSYMHELQNQIDQKKQHEAQEKQRRVVSERQQQVQLLQDLDLLRAQQLKQKREKTQHYRKALDAQVVDKKGTILPVCQSNDFPFTRCENPDSVSETREQAQKLFQVNFSAATQRKQDKLHNRLTEMEREREMLKQNRMGLILDQVNHFEKRQDVNKSLENYWSRSLKSKQQREDEERCFLRSAGQLLVDKLVEYRRCGQCKRRTSNCGQSNIWRDSHYVSGSQFMI